ncbi:MAG: SRPBCC family protein [Ornithinimicrobium sp.]
MSIDQQIVSESITIDAPASVIFDILADPRQHSRIDGSGSVKGSTVGPDRLEKGATFGAKMKLFGVPYKISNRVVEFEDDARIAWRHFGGHRWRYILKPLGDAQTEVTEQFDYSRYKKIPAKGLEAANFPARNREGIQQTLRILKTTAEQDAR